MKKGSKRIVHVPCGMVAFYYSGSTGHGQQLDGQYAELLDGSTPSDGDLMLCGSCKRLIEAPGSELVEEVLQ